MSVTNINLMKSDASIFYNEDGTKPKGAVIGIAPKLTDSAQVGYERIMHLLGSIDPTPAITIQMCRAIAASDGVQFDTSENDIIVLLIYSEKITRIIGLSFNLANTSVH